MAPNVLHHICQTSFLVLNAARLCRPPDALNPLHAGPYAMICGTAAPWASNIYILFALGLVPALAASLGRFEFIPIQLNLPVCS